MINNSVLTPDASKALDKLGPFLALVCDYLQRGSKFFVVVGKPLQQWHAFDQLMFLSRLKTQSESGTHGIMDDGYLKSQRCLSFCGAYLLVCKVRLVFLLLWR